MWVELKTDVPYNWSVAVCIASLYLIIGVLQYVLPLFWIHDCHVCLPLVHLNLSNSNIIFKLYKSSAYKGTPLEEQKNFIFKFHKSNSNKREAKTRNIKKLLTANFKNIPQIKDQSNSKNNKRNTVQTPFIT